MFSATLRGVRRGSFALAWLLAIVFGSSAVSAQDFDPRGRRPKPGPVRPQPGRKPTDTQRAPRPEAPKKPDAPAPPNEAGQIDRYTAIVLAQPGAAFPLQRLVQLYRERDGNLKALVGDFEARAKQDSPARYAATVGLAGIYKVDGRADEAIAAFEKAILLKATDPAALLSLARLLQDRANVPAARARYEQALVLQTATTDREQTLRALMTLSLDAKDWDAARGYHEKLVKLQPASLFVRGELGRELFTRGEYERAERELLELVQAASGDNRALAPALKDLGRAQAKALKREAALTTLRRALKTAGSEAAVRSEIYEIITEVYRAEQRLPELVKELEAEHPRDFARLSLLGGLYEETGDAPGAIKTYKLALAIQPRHVDLRLKLVRLLQSQGELDTAIREYEGLIRAAPNNPQFVFEQCEALLQRGDRPRALRLLTELEARAGHDEDVLGRLAEFYGRVGEGERALKILARLAQVATNDPSHLVDLGARYFQDGNHQLAMQTWRRILVTVTPRARALAAFGEVLLEHDMLADGLAALKEAVQLERDNVQYKKQLAAAHERAKSYRDAQGLWTEIGERARKLGDKLLAREVRSHLVTLWALERSLEHRIPNLATAFSAKPPDLEAGRTLAEVQLHLRRLGDAETTLRRLVELAPGDSDGYLVLERVLYQAGKKADAIAVLEKLLAVEPKRAREVYQRMARYAAEIYRDDDAVKYLARAVELNPDDAEGHRHLADMYRARQNVEQAILEYRAAISKNERLFLAYFDLADLLLSRGQTDEADRLFRRVLRSAPDEELVSRAARLSIQVNLGRGSLESLEQDLLPMAIGNPQKLIYRRLLMEVYGSLTFGLVEQAKSGGDAERDAAQKALARIGARAIKPLLDALASNEATQQRTAIDVLSHVENKNAAPALFAFATGDGDLDLRTRAMVACGMLRSAVMRPKLEAFLLPDGARSEEATPSDRVAVAAVFALAKLDDKRAGGSLRILLRRGGPEMRGFAALGLGALKERAATPDLVALARSVEVGSVARAAAAQALGELSPEGEAASVLLSLAQGSDVVARQAALVALGRAAAAKGDGGAGTKAVVGALAAALFDGPPGEGGRNSLPKAAAASMMLLASPASAKRSPAALDLVDGRVDLDGVLARLIPTEFTAAERGRAVTQFGDAIAEAASAALRTSGERALLVLDALSSGDGSLRPFFSTEQSEALGAARDRARAMAKALEPSVVGLVRHPEPAVRAKALQLLAGSTSDEATSVVLRAATDPNEGVQRMALAAVGRHASSAAVATCTRVVEGSPSWAIRVLAAEALGRLGKSGAPSAAAALERAARSDTYAIVREASLRALSFDGKTQERLARVMASSDAEPRVRETARSLLGRAP